MGLRGQISFASALMVMSLSLVLSFYAGDNSKSQIEQSQGEAFAQRAKGLLDVMDRSMFERSREIQNVAGLNDMRDPAVALERKRALLENLQQNFNAYAWIGMCDAQGIGVVGTGKYLEGKDLSKRPWCSEGRKGVYVGDMHDALLLAKMLPNPTGIPFYLVDVAAPVHDNHGKLLGVLCGHIYWNWVEEMLDSKQSPGKDIFIVSQDGLVLSGPAVPRSNLSALAPKTLQAISAEGKPSGYLLERWQDGRTYLVGYAKSSGYRGYQGMGWIGLVRENVTQAYAPAIHLRNRILLVGALLGVLFACLGWLLAERIARPIVRISQAADKIAGGDLDQDVTQESGDGEVAHLAKAIHDMVAHLTQEIAQRRLAEQGLRLSARVFEQSNEAIMITDAQRNIVTVNRAFIEIFGYTESEVLGNSPRMFKSGRQSAEFYRSLYADLASTGQWHGEMWNKRKSGEVFPEWVSISAVRDEQGEISNYIAIYLDLSASKKEQERIAYLASYDMLTGLPNRYLLNDRLEQGLNLAKRHDNKLAVLFVDLDHFKNINDILGHDVGDEMLRMAAERLKSCLRRTDTLARQGGDEFVAVLGDIESVDEVTFVVEKMIASLCGQFGIREHQLGITTSIGVSIFPDDGEDAVTLMRNADMAMYRAKDAGRNRFQYFEQEMNEQAMLRMRLENDLRQALAKGELMLYYQPKVNIASGAVAGMEALLRWQHPRLGFISPAQFIPVAEESGLINEIGDWVLHQAALQQRIWQSLGYTIVPVAVNLSARQFAQHDLVEKIVAIVRNVGISSEFIELELTESLLMDVGVNSLEVMRRLDAAGFNLALDDFGTGYSSLSRLKLLPVKSLKIDQSFVRDIATDENDESIVNATTVLAHAMEMKVIAEGVETQQQLDYLRDLHCEEYQGYLFSRPVPANQAVKFLVSKAV